MGRILSINVGKVRPLKPLGHASAEVLSAIEKLPVSTLADPVAVTMGPLGMAGDEQADPSVHGGPDKAIYAYPVEHYPVWRTLRQQALGVDEPLPHGAMGENFTVEGLTEKDVWVGDVLLIGAPGRPRARLRVVTPRSPCFKFNARMGFKQAAKMMVQSGYTGFYLQVLEPQPVLAGDPIELLPGARVVSIAEQHALLTRGMRP